MLAGVLVSAVLVAALVVGRSDRGAGVQLAVLVVVGGIAAVVLTERPDIVALAVIAGGATILPSRPFPVELAGIRTDAVEAGVVALLAAWVVGRLLGRIGATPYVGAPLLLLAIATVVAAWVANSRGSTVADLIGPVKTMAFYLAPLPLGWCLAHAGRAHLERALLAIASVGSALVLAERAIGLSFVRLPTVDEVVTLGQSSSVLRVRPALLALVVPAAVVVVSRLATRPRTADVVRLALFSGVLAVSFNRSSILAVLLGGLFVSWRLPGERFGRTLAAATVGLVVVAGGVLVASTGALGGGGEAFAARLTSVLDPEVREESSYQDRGDENEAAVRAIRRSPLTGVGLNRPFGIVNVSFLESVGRNVRIPQVWIHNTFLGVWLHLGALGIAAFVWLGMRVARAVRASALAHTANEHRIAIAGAGALLAMAAQSLFQTSMLHRPTILGVGIAVTLAVGGPPAVQSNRSSASSNGRVAAAQPRSARTVSS